jgi:hypothetical protein
MKVHPVARWASLLTVPVLLTLAFTQEKKESKTPAPEKAEAPLPDYPKVNVATWYEVDPDWPKKPAEFEWAAVPGIAVDAQDQVYVFTRAKPPVQVYASDGSFVRAWGEDDIETAHHLKIDRDGAVWVADIGLHVVRKFTPEGKLLMTIGTPGTWGEDKTHLNQPTDMVIAPSGDIFVSDGYGNSRIVHFDRDGKFIKAWGTLGTGAGEFSLPHAIAMDSGGRLYIADRNNVRVQIYDQGGRLVDSWQNLVVPWGFWVTEKDEIWVCGSSPSTWSAHPDYPGAPLGCPPKDQLFARFDTTGKVKQLWTLPKGVDGKEQPGDVNWVHALAADSKGNLYAGDIIGKRAQKFVKKRR